jgi:membrane protease YdiL (CAAX protease family)
MTVMEVPESAPDAVSVAQKPSYLDWSAQGRGSGWLYLAGTSAILFVWLVGSALLAIPLLLDPGAINADGSFDLGSVWLNNLVALITFVPLFVAVPLVVWLIHGRPWRTVITPFRSFNFRLVGIGAAVWTGLLVLGLLIGVVFGTDELVWVFDSAVFIPNLIVLLALLFIQTTAEELFFRGYLVQWFGLVTRSRWLQSAVIGFVFMVPHMLNPEVADLGGFDYLLGVSGYFFVGFALTWVCINSGTIELAIGAHFANNMLVSVLLSPENSVLGSASLFETGETDLFATAVFTAVTAVLFILITWRVRGNGVLIPALPVRRPPHTLPVFGAGPMMQERAWPMEPIAPPPMGWYPDPYGRAEYRLWNGYYWTTDVAYPRVPAAAQVYQGPQTYQPPQGQ